MSDPKSKQLHSKRLFEKQLELEKQLRIVRSLGLFEETAHKYHKRKALDCGNTNCGVCGNPRRLYKHRTFQELKLFLKETDE